LQRAHHPELSNLLDSPFDGGASFSQVVGREVQEVCNESAALLDGLAVDPLLKPVLNVSPCRAEFGVRIGQQGSQIAFCDHVGRDQEVLEVVVSGSDFVARFSDDAGCRQTSSGIQTPRLRMLPSGETVECFPSE
jgi:hypothetical protein